MSRETKRRHLKATPARLDVEGIAKPKTQLLTHGNMGHCRLHGPAGGALNPGEILEYEAEDGNRMTLNVETPDGKGIIGKLVPPSKLGKSSAAERTLDLFPYNEHLRKPRTCSILDLLKKNGIWCCKCGWCPQWIQV